MSWKDRGSKAEGGQGYVRRGRERGTEWSKGSREGNNGGWRLEGDNGMVACMQRVKLY